MWREVRPFYSYKPDKNCQAESVPAPFPLLTRAYIVSSLDIGACLEELDDGFKVPIATGIDKRGSTILPYTISLVVECKPQRMTQGHDEQSSTARLLQLTLSAAFTLAPDLSS